MDENGSAILIGANCMSWIGWWWWAGVEYDVVTMPVPTARLSIYLYYSF